MSETMSHLLDRAGNRAGTEIWLFDRGVPMEQGWFRAEVLRIAAGLTALGIKPGDRVAIWLPNVPAWLTLLFALARLGVIAVSVNTRFKSHELASILRRSRPRALIYWPGFAGIDFAGILAGCDPEALTSLSYLVEYGESDVPARERNHRYTGSTARLHYAALPAAPHPPDDASSPSAPCVLFSTSGTTKEPKLVLHNQATLVRHARYVARAWHLGSGSAIYLVPPLCGVYGFCTALAAFAGGVPLWMRPVWDATFAAAEIERGCCSHITGTDDVYAQLLAERPHETRVYPTLRYAGFAPFNPALGDIVARAEQRGLRLSGLYGTSEVQALFSVRAGEHAASERGSAGGYPVDPAARVRARDPATGGLLPHDSDGELEIYAPGSRMVGYLGDAAATAAAFTEDGWYRTGDLGHTTCDGGFVYVARAGDSLRLGGFLVSPLEIETVIGEAGGIKACQVVAVPRPEGMRAVAFIIPEDGSRVDEVRLSEHLRARLASYKIPIRFFAIDAFPVTASANGTKIRRDALRQRALELLGAA